MPIAPAVSATTMFCIGTVHKRDAAVNSATVRALAMAKPPAIGSMSLSSAVHRSARTWLVLPPVPSTSLTKPASEITGPWRVLRTVMFTSGLPLTLMTSCAVSKATQPSGVRYIASLSALTCSMYRSCTSGPVFVKPQAKCSF